jgi:hypothetical protein
MSVRTASVSSSASRSEKRMLQLVLLLGLGRSLFAPIGLRRFIAR